MLDAVKAVPGMRVPFNSVFTFIDGRLIPQSHIAFGNITIASGVSLSPGLLVSGNEIKTLINSDLAIDDAAGIVVILGFYTGNDLPEPLRFTLTPETTLSESAVGPN
jgi:hypothetical protein